MALDTVIDEVNLQVDVLCLLKRGGLLFLGSQILQHFDAFTRAQLLDLNAAFRRGLLA